MTTEPNGSVTTIAAPTTTDLDALAVVAPALVVGGVCVVAGGLLAAVTAAHPSQPATWAAAYLVLVAGVSQLGLAIGQALLFPRVGPPRLVRAEFVAWNVGNALVLSGTLLHITALVDGGGALLVVALGIALAITRHPPRPRPWTLLLFRALATVLLVSIPIGLWLARLGGG